MRTRHFLALCALIMALLLTQTAVFASDVVLNIGISGCDVTLEATVSEAGNYAMVIWDLVNTGPGSGLQESFFTDDGTGDTHSDTFTLPDSNVWYARIVDLDPFHSHGDVPVQCEEEVDNGGTEGEDEDADEDEDNPGPPFEPGDARINRHAWAPVAIYCDDASSLLTIYAINPATGGGALALSLPYSHFAQTVTTNTLLASQGAIQVFQSVEGTWVVRAPQADGKLYQFAFSGCPYQGDGQWSEV